MSVSTSPQLIIQCENYLSYNSEMHTIHHFKRPRITGEKNCRNDKEATFMHTSAYNTIEQCIYLIDIPFEV